MMNVANTSTSSGEEKGLIWEFKKKKLASSVHMKNEVDRYLSELDENGIVGQCGV